MCCFFPFLPSITYRTVHWATSESEYGAVYGVQTPRIINIAIQHWNSYVIQLIWSHPSHFRHFHFPPVHFVHGACVFTEHHRFIFVCFSSVITCEREKSIRSKLFGLFAIHNSKVTYREIHFTCQPTENSFTFFQICLEVGHKTLIHWIAETSFFAPLIIKIPYVFFLIPSNILFCVHLA